MDRVRRSSMLLLVVVLLALIPTNTPAASAASQAQADERSEAPPTPPYTVQIPNYTQRPGIALEVVVAPEAIALNETATITLTISNRAPHPARNIIITLPTPDGTVPLPGAGFVSADGWR